MKRIREFFENFSDDHPLITAIMVLAVIVYVCHWLGVHTSLSGIDR